MGKTICDTCLRLEEGECKISYTGLRKCPRYQPTGINMYLHPEAVCNKCHDLDRIDCTRCYCPEYHKNCLGDYRINEVGGVKIKDCSNCVRPHIGRVNEKAGQNISQAPLRELPIESEAR